MDQITIERIKLLHPLWRERVLDAYTHINNRILGRGVRLRFAYTYRTVQEQNELFAIGRTKLFDASGKRLGKVTNAKGGQSIHNYGLAFDIVLLLDRDGNGTFESASWDITLDFDKDGKADWMDVVDEFKRLLGVEWGGDWKRFKDAPHFQVKGVTWQQLNSTPSFVDKETGLVYPDVKIAPDKVHNGMNIT